MQFFLLLILALTSQFTSIQTAPESKKHNAETLAISKSAPSRKSQRLEQIQLTNKSISNLVQKSPILDEGFQLLGKGKNGLANFLYAKYSLQRKDSKNNLQFEIQRPEIIAEAEEIILQNKIMEKTFMADLRKLINKKCMNPKIALAENSNSIIQYIQKHSVFMQPALQRWVNKPNKHMRYQYALIAATRMNNIPMVEMLLHDMNADVNVQEPPLQQTPLHIAIFHNHPEIIKLLLTTPGINVDLVDLYMNNSPALHNVIDVVYDFSEEKKQTILDMFISTKTDMNSKNKHGDTLLHLESKYGHLSCLKKIITASNLDLNIQNNNGDTPLHYAAGSIHYNCAISILIAAGVNLNICNKDGNTPLHIAVKEGYIHKTRQLILAGADKNIHNNDFQTAEDLATTPAMRALFQQNT